MEILVTGHKGFIGSHLFKALKDSGYSVSGFDIGDSFPDKRFDIIFHLAARGLIRKSIEMPFEYYMDDLNLTMRFLEYARIHNSIFVFPTSGSTAEATNPYSLSKKHSVDWINLYTNLYNIKSYILRFFNIYGPGARKGAVYLFTKAALKETEAIVYGDGTHVRDFLNVSDVVRICQRIIKGEIVPGSYEVGSGTGTSVNDLIAMVEDITGKKVKTRNLPYIVKEAEALVASEQLLPDPKPLSVGIKEVMEFIKNDTVEK